MASKNSKAKKRLQRSAKARVQNKTKAKAERGETSPLRKGRRLLLRLALILLLLLVIPPLAAWVWVESRAAGRIAEHIDQVRPAQVALVLGTSPGTKAHPNAYFEHRMDATAALYQAGKVERILVSGDNREAYYNEVAAMREALVERGVPEAVIEGDDAGLRTLDSVIRAREVFGEEEVLVVSQHFHTARAIAIARHHGINARGFAAPDVDSFGMIRTLVREVGARMKMIADLYWLDTEPPITAPQTDD